MKFKIFFKKVLTIILVYAIITMTRIIVKQTRKVVRMIGMLVK